jgi:pimeloyl-ACP methyl ester carboxylesterase
MVFESDGAALHYQTIGEGEPLLWLPGFMGAGADWTYIFKEPPAGFRLIAPDPRGHGASFDPRATPSDRFSFRQAARDVQLLLQHLEIDRVKAIGLSGGGITLLHLATAKPAAVVSMVLVSAPPYFPAQCRAIQRNLSASMFDERDMDLMRKRHPHGENQIQQLLAQGRNFADTYDDVNFTPPYLGTIAADTLIVFGDRDPFYPVSLALDLHSAIPRSFLWVVPNGGHGPVFGDAAPLFTSTALSFLRGEWG